jgi:nitrite reductase (NO-forming)
MKFRHLAVLAVLVLGLAACNGDGAELETAPVGEEGTVEIDVSMIDIDFVPASASVPSGATLVVNLTNDGAIEHDFELDDGSGSGMMQPGDAQTIEIGPFTESTTAYCTVPGHREAGMEFDINVN